jgi:hypothetical protein
MTETTVYGITKSELTEAILFYQKFKTTPTYQATLKQIKREYLEAELTRIHLELDNLS